MLEEVGFDRVEQMVQGANVVEVGRLRELRVLHRATESW